MQRTKVSQFGKLLCYWEVGSVDHDAKVTQIRKAEKALIAKVPFNRLQKSGGCLLNETTKFEFILTGSTSFDTAMYYL
jgi:hypothetical protein